MTSSGHAFAIFRPAFERGNLVVAEVRRRSYLRSASRMRCGSGINHSPWFLANGHKGRSSAQTANNLLQTRVIRVSLWEPVWNAGFRLPARLGGP